MLLINQLFHVEQNCLSKKEFLAITITALSEREFLQVVKEKEKESLG